MKPNYLYIILSLAVISISYTLSPYILHASPSLNIEEINQAKPDLVVTEIKFDPPELEAGAVVDIQAVIQNQGDAVAPVVKMQLYLEPEATPVMTTTATAEFTYGLGIEPNQTYDGWKVTGLTIEQAEPYVCIWVDPDNTVEESDETNNMLCINEPPPPAPEEDSYEDDDSCDLAQTIPLDAEPQERNLTRDEDDGTENDFDWVKFEAESGVTYVARATGVGADADLNLSLYSTCESPPSFGQKTSVVFTAPQDGEYYLVATHAQNGYSGQTGYTLEVKSLPACSLFREPNNSCNMPVDYPLSDEDGQPHSFCEEGDVDWVRFQVQAGGRYRVTATDEGPNANLKMGMFRDCNDAGLADMETEFEATKNGQIYLKFENTDPSVYGIETRYRVLVEELARGCEQDIYEDDNNISEAQPLSINSNKQTHNICPRRDQDWVEVTAQKGVTFTVETYNLDKDADTKLCLHDSNGTELACDRDNGAGLGSRLIIPDPQEEKYYFSVTDEDPEVAGKKTEYNLRAFTDICQPDSYEPDNELADANPLTADDTPQVHNICQKDDVDWISFEGEANTFYTIYTDDVGPEADTELELYDENERLIARNDDHTPGITSQLVYQVTQAGTYYVKAQLYNPTDYGTGTEYSIKIVPGQPPAPTPTPTPTPPGPQPTPTPPPATEVRTLILVHTPRLEELHGDNEEAGSVQTLLSKLQELASHERVKGEIIYLNRNQAVVDAYAGWTGNAEGLKSVERANQVTDAIRRLIMTYLSERQGVEYVVLVGDDQAIPFRRVQDHTPQQSEKTYNVMKDNHPTGAAILADYFMTDDYYVDREPTPHKGRELYLPDLAISRLIETPNDMIKIIDIFLANPVTEVENVLVTGYDFVKDSASKDCVAWRKELGDDNVECLIGENWSERDIEDLQLSDDPPYKIQSINGHADHDKEGIPRGGGGGDLSASEIAEGSMDLSGGLIYTLACHGGLNVPEANGTRTTDLPEVFTRFGANYVGNTGYGWGYTTGIGLSELVIQFFTKELLKGGAMGQSLMSAKQQYYQRTGAPTPYDEKVVQQLIFYGLPMFEIPSVLSVDDPFADVSDDFDFAGLTTDEEGIASKEVTFDFAQTIDPDSDISILSTASEEEGAYQEFGGFSYATLDQPIQPLFFRDVTVPDQTVRSVVILEAEVADVTEDFTPIIASPDNEFVDNPAPLLEVDVNADDAWYPPINVQVQALNGDSNLSAQLGQYNPATGQQRTYENLKVELFYSTSSDVTGPEFRIIDGLYRAETGVVEVKAGIVDPSGIQTVILNYVVDSRQASNSIQSTQMTFNASSQKWEATFTGDLNSLFFVSAVDRAGNRTTEDNKGAKYRPAPGRARISLDLDENFVYLPLIEKIQ